MNARFFVEFNAQIEEDALVTILTPISKYSMMMGLTIVVFAILYCIFDLKAKNIYTLFKRTFWILFLFEMTLNFFTLSIFIVRWAILHSKMWSCFLESYSMHLHGIWRENTEQRFIDSSKNLLKKLIFNSFHKKWIFLSLISSVLLISTYLLLPKEHDSPKRRFYLKLAFILNVGFLIVSLLPLSFIIDKIRYSKVPLMFILVILLLIFEYLLISAALFFTHSAFKELSIPVNSNVIPLRFF